MEDKVNKELL